MDRTLITGANVYIRDIGYQSDVNAINVNCHKFNKRWFSESDLKRSKLSESKIQYYSPEVLSSNVICHSNGASLTPLHTYSFDITPLVTDVWRSSIMNERCWDTGIMFKADNEVENGNNVHGYAWESKLGTRERFCMILIHYQVTNSEIKVFMAKLHEYIKFQEQINQTF
ncbi:MAG: hypothetical protein NC485_04800 [Ruminococcus flavefaciens]|nr:hypothetical protein [Ruminococcus flavefaciens]MCM1061144.1 hypothetical protein [Eubacterium sp.]